MAEYVIHLKLAQKHILAVSVGKKLNDDKQMNKQTDWPKKMITIYSETCVIETTVRSRQGCFFAGIGVGVLMLLLLQ